jgi:MFS family permease
VRAYVAGIAVGFAVGWNIANVGAVATDLARAYGVGLATIGLFTTALFVVHMAMQIPAGRLVDRFGARRVALVAAFLLMGGNAVALVAPHEALALLGRGLTGLGTATAFVAGSDYIRARGGSPVVQGIFGGASVAAPGLALLVVPQLEHELGFRAPFLTAIAVALCVLLLLAAAPPAPRTAGHRDEAIRGDILRDRRLYRFAAIHAASFGFSVVVGNWIVTLLEHRGHSHRAAAAAGSLTLLLGFFTRIWGGWILRAHPHVARSVVAASLAVGGLATAALAAPLPLGALIAAAAVLGLAAGVPFAMAFAGAAAARPDAPGAAIGFVNGWAAAAILVCTPLVGLTFSLPGDGRIGFLALGALWTLAAVTAPRDTDLALEPRYARAPARELEV